MGYHECIAPSPLFLAIIEDNDHLAYCRQRQIRNRSCAGSFEMSHAIADAELQWQQRRVLRSLASLPSSNLEITHVSGGGQESLRTREKTCSVLSSSDLKPRATTVSVVCRRDCDPSHTVDKSTIDCSSATPIYHEHFRSVLCSCYDGKYPQL